MKTAPRVLASLVPLALLLAAAGCGDTNEPRTGALRLSVVTTGGDLDLNGYVATVDGAEPRALPTNGSAVIGDIPTGSHDVAFTDVAANCTLSGQNPRAVNVAGGDTTDVALTIACVATGVRVTTATTGIDLDPDGYAVSVDGVLAAVVGANGSVEITRLAVGSHTVALTAVAANCPMSGTNPRSVMVAAGEVVPVAFAVSCVAVTGVIEVTAATSGLDLDPSGYTVQVDGGSPQPLAINGTVRFPGLAAGDHSVTVGGAAGNCTVGGANPRTVPVTTGGTTRDTARTTFDVSCMAVTGVIEVTTATSGVDLDANGYQVSLDGGTPQAVGVNGVVRFSGVSGGDHLVSLGDAAPNCLVSGENPRTLPVAVGGVTRDTARTTFAVACEPATGTARIITSTTGADLDPDGYWMVVDCYDYYGIGCYYYYHAEQMSPNDTVVLAGVSTGSHTFQIDDVAPNCTVSGGNPRTVHVTGGATTDIVFTVACVAFGGIQVTATTTGVDLDATGYRITADGATTDAASNVAVNETLTLSGLLAGSYTVSLGGVSLNCAVTTPNPVVVTVSSGGTAPVSFAAACTAATQLAFAMSTGPSFEIHTIASNGGGSTQLTNNTAYENAPDWSPDGSQIAFRSDRDGNPEIYVMQASGSGQTRLTNHAAGDYRPTWSPDGTKIAFVSDRDGNAEIYVMDANGTGLQRLTNHSATDDDPAWSPDGTQIAFSSDRAGNFAIYVMNSSNGSTVTQLTASASADSKLTWSPDGTKIVFSRVASCDYYYCERDLYVMNADGSGVTQLTSGGDDHADPAWSPDSQWIAFNAAPCDYYGCSEWAIRAVRSNGTDLREITGSLAFHPAWRP